MQLRKAREDVFGISQMLLDTQAKNTEFAGYLRQRGGEASEMRKQIDTLTTSLRVSDPQAGWRADPVRSYRPTTRRR
ncbi:hypothetical protein [Pseudomonas sp. HY7a-MNA-CIBAN-0227]|uniref:hypothetical protein n=1 Tax=Pseudomonas sp. HY7a-MNA-CIBAN-0227 TaxID=3140474 RepID=UPI00332D27F5